MNIPVWLKFFNLPSHKRGFKPSGNYQILETFLDRKFDFLQSEHIDKWSFFKSRGVEITRLDKKRMTFDGGFDGNAYKSFFNKNYFPAYIKEFCKEGCELSIKNCRDLNLNQNRCLNELLILLIPRVGNFYNKISNLVSRLEGKNGIPAAKRRIIDIVDIDFLEKIVNSYKLGRIDNFFWYLEQFLKRVMAIKNLFIAIGVGYIFNNFSLVVGFLKKFF